MTRIPYMIVSKGQPGEAGGGKHKYYPALLPRRKVKEDRLMHHLEDVYSIKRSDYKRVMMALQESILYFLSESNNLELGELGYVSLNIKASGEDEPARVGLHNIKEAGLHLRFSKHIKAGLQTLTFEKATARELERKGKGSKS